jgi:hypothetical protein
MADEKKNDVLELAKKRFKLCQEAEDKARAKCLEDVKFALDPEAQWPAAVRALREGQKKPCLSVNRTKPMLHQVTNAQRQNRVSAKVSPVDDKADIKTAEIIQGVIRNIEYASDAEIAYDTGGFYAACGGFGAIEVVAKYCDDYEEGDPRAFDQEICINEVPNPFQVYWDPESTRPDASDANYAFKVTRFSKEEYKAEFGDSEAASMDKWESGVGDSPETWMGSDHICVIEYYYKEREKKTLYKLAGGSVTTKEPEEYDRKRESGKSTVKWCKLNAVEVLEETVLPGSGKYIPLVKVVGEQFFVDGERIIQGLVRDSKDPQRRYNYMVSAEAEAIGMAPKTPWIMEAGQAEGFESLWKSANSGNHQVLFYNGKNLNGTPAPPPKRVDGEANIAGISQAMAQAIDDHKATTGIYDASLGNESNEKSGKAILARQQQGDTSNFHLVENVKRSISLVCKIIVDWLPNVYDTPRVMRILGEDGSHEMVQINQPFGDDPQKQTLYDFTTGKYDVICTAEQSFATKRQQAAETLLGLAATYPPLMQVAGDLIMKATDIPYAQEIADRLKPKGVDGQDSPEALQSQLAQAMQQNQELTQALHETSQEIETKKAENDTRIEVARIQQETALAVAEVKANAAASQATLEAELQNVHALLSDIRGHIIGQDAAQNDAARQATLQAQQPAQPVQQPPA